MNSYLNQNLMPNSTNFNPYWPNQLPRYSANPIQGKNAAWQFPMGPNSEIYLPDANEDIIWWIRTDNNGNRNVQGFDITLHEDPKQVDTNDLAARLAAVEEWINAKSNKSNAKRTQSVAVVE